MTARKELRNWVAVGGPLLALAGLLVAIGLHLGCGVPWVDLAVPVSVFVGLQAVTFVAMFWAGRLARRRNGLRIPILVAGFYCWATGLLLMYYGSKWRFLGEQQGGPDYVTFSVLIGIAIAVSLLLFSIRRNAH